MRGLKSMIAPSFYCLHNDIKRGLHTHYWLKGGRGSGKSSFAEKLALKLGNGRAAYIATAQVFDKEKCQ